MASLIPFDWLDPIYLWWRAYRDHLKNAKRFPEQAGGYCRAAMIARMEYECLSAQKMVKEYYR
jgi:hypothetical protein